MGIDFDYTREDFVSSFEDTPTERLFVQAEIAGGNHHEALVLGCMWCMDQIEHVPVLPIVAGEKGLKTRFPTATLTACNLIQQVLRRAIDHILINDPRMSEGLGGADKSQFVSNVSFYSQDMSYATDTHPFWLTKTVYEELVKSDSRLTKYLPYFDKLFGLRGY